MHVFKCLQIDLPPYFHSDLTPYSCIFNTRLSNPSNHYLTTVSFDCKVHKSKWFFDSSFSVGALQLWNSLPLDIRTAMSLAMGSFCHKLKPYLYEIAYPRQPPKLFPVLLLAGFYLWQPFYILRLYDFGCWPFQFVKVYKAHYKFIRLDNFFVLNPIFSIFEKLKHKSLRHRFTITKWEISS